MRREAVKRPDLLLQKKKIIFWDFDGVIKDSLAVKSAGYEQLFSPYGKALALRVREHHEANGGVSRFEKIPIYLKWAGEPACANQVQEFCDQFASLVLQAVIDAPWVPGIREYLNAKYSSQYFALITATPQQEIEKILNMLKIIHCFQEVHGAPTPKSMAVADVLKRLNCQPDQALIVGDSDTDLEAAEFNNVTFLMRRTSLNKELQKRFQGLRFDYLSL